jgi:hypothetical protein
MFWLYLDKQGFSVALHLIKLGVETSCILLCSLNGSEQDWPQLLCCPYSSYDSDEDPYIYHVLRKFGIDTIFIRNVWP